MKKLIKASYDENYELSREEQSEILKLFNYTENSVISSWVEMSAELGYNVFIVEADNSNPTYLGWLQDKLVKLEDQSGIGFDSSQNDNGFYGRTYEFYKYPDM